METSTDAGASWQDAGPNITEGGYNGTITVGHFNPLAGRAAWVGSTDGVFTHVTVNLQAFMGQNLLFRMRLGTDHVVSGTGWWVDDFQVAIDMSDTTPTPTATPMIVGHVTWQGRPSQPNGLQQLPVTLTLKAGTVEVNYPSVNTDASGFFTVPVGTLPAGVYGWRAKGPKFLANAGTVTLMGAPTIAIEIGLMHTGDCNNDNRVTVADQSILRSTFGKGQGDPGYDDRADLNGDNRVNVVDATLLKNSFGLGGAPPLRP